MCPLLAACFLEHWKRRQMCLKHSWDLTSLEDEEVQHFACIVVYLSCIVVEVCRISRHFSALGC